MIKNYEISDADVRKLKRATSLDDESFRKLVPIVARALGASDRQIAMMTSNSGAIRAMIYRASDRDIRSLARKIGSEKTAEILEMIDGALTDEKT